MAADLRQLTDPLAGYVRELAERTDTQAVISYVNQVLASLLRRQGDAQFLDAVKSAFAAGVAGRRIEDQRRLAQSVLALVLAKRPIIAQAYRALDPTRAAAPANRRASDFSPPTLAAAVHSLPDSPVLADVDATAEQLVDQYFVGSLANKARVIEILSPLTPTGGDDHQLLARLVQEVDDCPDEDTIMAFVVEVLELCLRRTGDAEFLVAVRSAVASGLQGQPLAAQRALAREVFALLLGKRPEVAKVWHALHAEADCRPNGRRTTDNAPEALVEIEQAAPVVEVPAKRYRFAEVEAMVAADFAAELARRAVSLQIPLPPAPSLAYCSEQPFFLFSHNLATALKAFAREALIVLFRQTLERHVYRFASRRKVATPAQRDAFLGAKRDQVWQIVSDRLGKLVTHHAHALAKLQMAVEAPPEANSKRQFRIVKKAVTAPRIYRVCGVEFKLGKETVITTVRVPVKLPTDLEPVEQGAVDLFSDFMSICQDHGVVLPKAAQNFEFLHTLLRHDTKKFSQNILEFSTVCSNKKMMIKYILEKMRQFDLTEHKFIGDTFVLSIFYANADRYFTFSDLCDIFLQKSDEIDSRPFAMAEIDRRPAELLWQLHVLLAKGQKEENIFVAALMLLSTCRELAKRKRLDDFAAVLQRLPDSFIGTPRHGAACEISAVLGSALAETGHGSPGTSKKSDEQAAQRIRDIFVKAKRRRPGLSANE